MLWTYTCDIIKLKSSIIDMINSNINKYKTLMTTFKNYNIVELVEIDDVFYSISQTSDESREIYLDRITYISEIIKKYPNLTLDMLIQKSYVWRNITYHNMIYPSSVTNIKN